jgi:hypothetical protein
VYLPSPGSWNDTSFTASGLANLSDRSVIPRLDYSVQILTYLNLNAFVMGHLGSQGEFNYSYSQPPLLDPQLAALIPPEAANDIPAEVIEGVQVRGPLLTLGIGVRTQF